QAVETYTRLEGRRSDLQLTFTLVFVVVALLLLLAAVWMGVFYASRLAGPISRLIGAAERVRAGDLTVRIADTPPRNELGTLVLAFDAMTGEIESQRRDLIEVNRQLDQRRRFTETVLAGVGAGVLGVRADGAITLANLSASTLFGGDPGQILGLPLLELLPELSAVWQSLTHEPARLTQTEITIDRPEATRRTLLVRITAESEATGTGGYVVTLDDISELLAAQRKAAWADVARRIAHEIKNPLTPIQLAAERLKRKYLEQIHTDPETFVNCTDTIVRQVADMGRMVDAFSDFARMPAPVMRKTDLAATVRRCLILYEQARGDIVFRFDAPETPLWLMGDDALIGQAVTNLLRNAVQAIDARAERDRSFTKVSGHITLAVVRDADSIHLTVTDNGIGLPEADRERLTEPYVTTRIRGTGLGLAIVHKVMEDHRGLLTLNDNDANGAEITLIFPGMDKE
ncbi:MAG: ATP-binding protein, partial [Pseudomonadota bacterium]|nr:ATP-binding protein [Pseudomonadota bacterium]